MSVVVATGPAGAPQPAGFEVHLEVFEGPFAVLLGLIGKHQLDVTEVALSRVTDEFLGYIKAAGAGWDLGQATEFLVIAATLLDLKTARLLPSASVDDEEDLALLEARDLLFARLLQYRAYKQAAALLSALQAVERRYYPRAVGLEPWLAALAPPLSIGVSPEQFATVAAAALRPRETPVVATSHVHTPRVSVAEHVAHLADTLARCGWSSFRGLAADCTTTLAVVARFLALLELYRDGLVSFEQVTPLGDLQVRWARARQESA